MLVDTWWQGPKLTFLGRRQVATEIFFFSRHMEKCGRQKAEKKVSIKFFLRSETQTKIFGCQMENSRLRLRPQWQFIHLPLKNHDEWIECRLYTQFHKNAKCFKSTLYLLSSLPFGEEMYPIEKLPVGSLLYVQNRKRSFLSRSVKTIDGSPCCSHQATTVQHFSFKKTWQRSFALLELWSVVIDLY